MVERAPEGADPEVTLTVVEPKKVPAGVGGRPAGEEQADEPAPPAPEGEAPPAAEQT
jgi:hypothetical protein